MSAADLLRVALDEARTMRADTDAWGELGIWDADDTLVFVASQYDQAEARLIGLLLAAAPHLADLLDRIGAPSAALPDDTRALIDAITEAGGAL